MLFDLPPAYEALKAETVQEVIRQYDADIRKKAREDMETQVLADLRVELEPKIRAQLANKTVDMRVQQKEAMRFQKEVSPPRKDKELMANLLDQVQEKK